LSPIIQDGCFVQPLTEQITEQILEKALQEPALSFLTNLSKQDNHNVIPVSAEQCTAKVKINNIILEALIDSGASHNYICEGLCNKLREAGSPGASLTPVEPFIGRVIVGNTEEMIIKGQVNFTITVQDNEYITNFHILSGDMSTQIVLGWQGFIKPNKACLDGANNRLIFPEQNHGSLYLRETITIPAYSERIVTATTRYKTLNHITDVYLENFEPLMERTGLLIAPGIQTMKAYQNDQALQAVLTNMSARPVCVPAYTIIAKIEPFQQDTLKYPPKLKTQTSCEAKMDVGNEIVNQDLTTAQIEKFKRMLANNDDIFTKGTRPSVAVGVTHKILLQDTNSRPVHCAPGRTAQTEREVINKQITEMLSNGVIKESRSPWSSRVVLIKKKDGKPRFCIDYRKLNGLTKSDVYPLPRIDDSLAALQKGNFFTTLDMFAGYWQIPMDEASKEMTAFISEAGLYQFEVMPFGLKTAGATFQRFMDAILAGLKWKSLLVYLDDIVIFSSTFEQHLLDVEEVIKRLRNAGLQLNRSKCHFLREEFTYLGHIVSKHGIRPDPKKIEAILKMPTPTDATTTRSVLGSCSYFRKFIPDFAKISAPLYELTKDNQKFYWNDTTEEALKAIKAHLMQHPILCHPNFDYPFIVQCDACDSGLGAVLLQRISGRDCVIEWISRTLQPAERKWSVREKEALVIIWALEVFRPFLVGYKFIVESDHKSLKWLNEATTARLVRWACRLSEFDFEIQYKPGKQNTRADMLSRLPIPHETNQESNCRADNLMFNFELNSAEQPHVLHAMLSPLYHTPMLTEMFKKEQRADNALSQIIHHIETNGATEGFLIKDELLYCQEDEKDLLIVPLTMRETVMKEYHDNPLGGHLSRDKLLPTLKKRFYWNNMDKYVQDYTRRCLACALVKSNANPKHGLLRPITVTRPFQLVGVDIAIMRISETGYRYILVTIDYFTNWVEAIPMKNQTSEECIKAFFKSVVSRHGCPEEIMSDSGTQFMSGDFLKFSTNFNIKQRQSSPHSHQANGKIEKFIRFLKHALALLTNQKMKHKWDEVLDHCLFIYRTSHNRMLNDTPFYLINGRDAILPQDLAMNVTTTNLRKNKNNGNTTYQKQMAETLKEAYEKLIQHKAKEQSKYKRYYDQSHRKVNYNIGDQVLVLYDSPAKGPLMPRWEGPFTVIARIDAVIYRLESETKITTAHVHRMIRLRS